MTLLKVDNLKVHFPIRGGFFRRVVDHVKAVDGVSFELQRRGNIWFGRRIRKRQVNDR